MTDHSNINKNRIVSGGENSLGGGGWFDLTGGNSDK